MEWMTLVMDELLGIDGRLKFLHSAKVECGCDKAAKKKQHIDARLI